MSEKEYEIEEEEEDDDDEDVEEEEHEEEDEEDEEDEEEDEEEDDPVNTITPSLENSEMSQSDREYYNQFEGTDEYIKLFHPEEIHLSFEEIHNLSLVTRNEYGHIIDENHQTYPILSKYEKAKIIGLRVNQLNRGATTFIDTRNLNLDKVIIAEEELRQKKIPFIIKRPIPNGKSEYWTIQDLEMI
jgi:DNA-directed RNA polymerases I, II, and III subunit RPABC2